MKKLLAATMAFAALSGAAQAGLVCASAPELKVLQSTALQQQLMVAALTCHMREEYGRFVAAYRDGLVQSDAALKAFFAVRPRGEDYHGYKTRIANAASLRSVRDPRFCDSARRVFDMALGRSQERRGLAPEPPQLVDTGYEGCRAVDNAKLIEAKARPVATKVAMMPKPAPRPAGVPVKLAAAPTVRLLAAAPVPTAKPGMRVEVLQAHPHVAIAVPKPAPAALPRSKPVQKSVEVPALSSAPAPPPPLSPAAGAKVTPVVPPSRSRWTADTLASIDEDPSLFDRDETAVAESPRREPVRQAWRQPQAVDPDDPYADNPVPSAYRPGAEWVGDGGRSMGYDRPPPRGRWVLGRDGRWRLFVPRASRWEWD